MFATFILAAFLPCSFTAPNNAPAQDETSLLDGTWELVSDAAEGKTDDGEWKKDIGRIYWRISGNKVCGYTDNDKTSEGSLHLVRVGHSFQFHSEMGRLGDGLVRKLEGTMELAGDTIQARSRVREVQAGQKAVTLLSSWKRCKGDAQSQ